MDSGRCPLPGWHVSGPDSASGAGISACRYFHGRNCEGRSVLNRQRIQTELASINLRHLTHRQFCVACKRRCGNGVYRWYGIGLTNRLRRCYLLISVPILRQTDGFAAATWFRLVTI
jgi:hypothetical protein